MYQHVDIAEKDYICSLDKDNGMHRCSNFPPFREGDNDCYEPLVSIQTMNQTIISSINYIDSSISGNSSTHCINWNLYYTTCKAGN